MADITVVTPSHPARLRTGMLTRAMRSVYNQTLLPAAVSLAVDTDKQGAPRTRQRALEAVQTEWTAFLDSDDEFKPEHLQKLRAFVDETGCDYAYSWYDVVGGTDPRPWMFGKPFDKENPDQTTIVMLVRTELAKEVGFTTIGDLTDKNRLYAGEDWDFTQKCIKAGADIQHLPEKTWKWYHTGLNTSGLPGRGDDK